MLNTIADWMKEDHRRLVYITGHADNEKLRPNSEFTDNLHLSKARAEAVKKELSDRGIALERMEHSGEGDSMPLVPNTTENGKVKNVAEWSVKSNAPQGWVSTEEKDIAIGDIYKEGVFFSQDGEPRKNLSDRLQDIYISVDKLGLPIDKAEQVRALIDRLLSGVEDTDAPEFADMFPQWDSTKAYIAGDRVKYGELLYKCLQPHTAQPSWTPEAAPSLWVRIDNPSEEWPEWRQPTGAHDAYAKGDKVSYSGKHWTSTADGNVWAPGVYGLEAVA